MANLTAFIAFAGWPLVAIWLFRSRPIQQAILWTLVGGFLLLPAKIGIDLPGLPPLDKFSIPILAIFVLVLVSQRRSEFQMIPPNWIARILMLLLILGPIPTAYTNLDTVFFGEARVLSPLSPYDAVVGAGKALIWTIPFMVGWSFFKTAEDQREIVRIILVAGLAYSILMLFEVRFSPQLHRWVYGFFQHNFAQTHRGSGFRPVVFLKHGLWLAFFAMLVAVAAAILWRDAKENAKGLYLYAIGYMMIVLVLCKSLASLAYALLLVPLIMFFSPRSQIFVAVLLALVAISYPTMRGSGLFPVEPILSIARSIDKGRAGSLEYRFDNEDLLLARAKQRPLFGWGGWGRSRIYHQRTGKDLSTTDGYWIVIYGQNGLLGFISRFGLFFLPIALVWWTVRSRPRLEVSPVTSGLCLIAAINMIEFLPNSTEPPMTRIIMGALIGYALAIQMKDRAAAKAEQAGIAETRKGRTVI